MVTGGLEVMVPAIQVPLSDGSDQILEELT